MLFIASVACINLFCQNENQNLFYSDTSFVETLTRGTGDYAPYGSSFTPHGTFRVLIVYAGFYTTGVYDDDYPLSVWPNDPINDPYHLSVPNYVENGSPTAIFFSDVSQLSDPQYANVINLTRYYYEMSQGKFTLLGDVFKDPNPNSSTYGEPIRINVDPTGASGWTTLNKRVINKIKTDYAAYWDNIWMPYDNRQNNPNYEFDNSLYNKDGTPATGDGKVDFVIIHWRYEKNFDPEPVAGISGWLGTDGGIASLGCSVTHSNFTVSSGYTVTKGGMGALDITSFFPHEFAHMIYSSPHYMGANSTRGNFFYFPSAGWGMMSSCIHSMLSSLAWESWLLGWTDIVCGSSNEISDIKDASDLNTTGNYTLRDYVTTGDAIRIKIPGTTKTYLWIENHQKKSVSEIKPLAGHNPSWEISPNLIPDFETGLYMYLEDMTDTRDNYSIYCGVPYTNRIKPLNAQGNYDYIKSEYPKQDPNNSSLSDSRYFWNNLTYTFQRTEANPISGMNPWMLYFDDHHKYVKNSSTSWRWQHDSNPDGVIETYCNLNNGNLEASAILLETDGNNEHLTYASTYGINNGSIALGRRSDAFQVNDEVSISGIIPALNLPEYSVNNAKNANYYLNGLNVTVLSENPVDNSITIHISFNDYTLDNDKRWCGLIDLPNLTNNSNSDLIISEGVTLSIDKSGIPNRHSKTEENDFINPSVFTIKSGAKLEIKNGSEMIIKNTSKLVIENGGVLQINAGGKLTIEEGGIFQYLGGTLNLIGNNSFIDIAGNLNIGDGQTFTFAGNGYIKFSNPGPDNTYNITAGTGASMLFSGNGQSHKVLEIQQNTVHFPQLSSLTFQNCKIEMGYEKRMQADYSYPVTFNNVKVTSTTGAHNNHRSFLFIGQSNVTINNSIFEYGYYGIYGNLTWTDGAALFITNSTFRYNTQGINIYGKGLNLTNCNVVNNTNYGIYCNGMSFTSDFTDCTISNNGNGIYYFGSNGAHINMEDTYIQSNNVDGLITSGAFDVNMLCVDINANRYGIRTSNGTFIKPYTCDFSNNYNTIFLNYGYVSLYKKYNQLQAMNDNYTLYGRTPVIRPIRAEHNRWESNQNATPVYLDNYYLRTYQGNKPPMPVEVWDSNPLSIACHFLPPILIRTSSEHILEETTNNNLPTVTISEQTMPLDEAVSYLQQQSKNINSETAFLTIIEEYSNLISSCNTWTDSNNYSEIKLYMSIAYGDLHSIISDFYTFVNHDKANQSFINGIEKIILLNENLVTNSNLSYTDYYEYSLDIPLLYRIIGNYDDAISYLENLLYDFSDEQNKSEMEHIQTWLCKINAEKAATEGLLNIDEFFIAIEDCENCYSTKKSQQNIIGHNDEEVEVYDDSFNNKELSIENSFEIIPNPNQGNFKIKLLTSSNNCEIRIINSVGQTVKRLTSIKERLNEINITGLKTGYYKVVYIQDNEIIDTQTVIVK